MTIPVDKSAAFLSGFRLPVHEQRSVKLKVHGKIPEWLSGTFLRNGPALFKLLHQSVQHFFDGLALLQSYQITDGTIEFSTRYLQSKAYKSAMESGALEFGEFGTPQKRSVVEKIAELFKPHLTDNANVNLMPWSNELVAMTETCNQLRVEANSLETLGLLNYEDKLSGQITTAHPHLDFVHNLLVNFVLNVSKDCHYNVYTLPPGTAKRRLVASIKRVNPAYIHSFALTPQYVILIEYPLLLKPLELAFSDQAYIRNYHWRPEVATHYLVIDRENGALVGDFEQQTAFSFHQINAFQQEHKVFLDACVYEDSTIVDAFYFDRLFAQAKFPRSRIERVCLDLKNRTTSTETLLSEPFEFPRINYPSRSGLDYEVVYGAGQAPAYNESDFLNCLNKFHLKSGTLTRWHESSCYPGEPIFIRNPGSATEDDGVVLSVVLSCKAGGDQPESFLLFLDALTFTEVARATLPEPLPFALHGLFLEERS
ncbi:MAG TPA: carotenoid oxygenase family protein [Oculatellaceae cyanobacterium]